MRQFRNEIEKVAYELYEKSGKVDGYDFDHWLEAERMVAAWQEQQEAETAERKWPSGNGNPASPARTRKPRSKK